MRVELYGCYWSGKLFALSNFRGTCRPLRILNGLSINPYAVAARANLLFGILLAQLSLSSFDESTSN